MSLADKVQLLAGDIPTDIKIYKAQVISPVPIKIKLLEAPQLTPTSDVISVAESLHGKFISIETYNGTVEYEITPSLKAGDICLCIAYDACQKFILVDRL